jgi:GTP-binding protein
MDVKIALIGRPNVGKSTLFNRLLGRKLAIVDDMPGVTRDRKFGAGSLGDLNFTVIDTAGLEHEIEEAAKEKSADLRKKIFQQTTKAVEEANILLFLVDGQVGVTPLDLALANWARKGDKPLFLVVNKSEGKKLFPHEFYALGLGDPVFISAEHGEGLGNLYEILTPFFENPEEAVESVTQEERPAAPLQLAIVGRPNVGKSTLVNKLLGEDRVLTGPEAGITRDSILIPKQWKGQLFYLVDTAGLRRRSKVTEKVEWLSTQDTQRAIRFAQVVAMVIDATMPLEKQDLTIARQVAEEGRALILVVNKVDLISDKERLESSIRQEITRDLPQLKGLKIIFLSALNDTQQKVNLLFKAAFEVYEIWNQRISTSKLNRWLEAILEHHPPPLAGNRRIKIRYMTQIKSRPPTFVLFVSKPEELVQSYMRYLENQLRSAFHLEGVPLRLYMRKGDNPYEEK